MSNVSDPSAAACLAGGGEMGALIRATDWSRTPVGAMESWSPTLRMMISFLLANRFPLLLWWGPQYISLYNDAYRPILGTKHPGSIGQPVRECWSEIWHVLQPLIDTPFNGGPATWMDDLFLEINRHGFVEETHFTVAYSAVPDDTAPRGIGGVLATVHEITEKVIGERRVGVLRDLGARVAEAKTAEEACTLAAAVLADHPKDIPFALLYLIGPDGAQAHLTGVAGTSPGEPAAPLTVALDAAGPDAWPFGQVVCREEPAVVEDLAARLGRVPAGPWSDPPRSAVVVPVRSNKVHQLAGLLVAAVSPRLRLDELYRSFLELVASQIATGIANARAHEDERKRAEALAEIDRAKTAFFSNVSHEFRTPLTLMLGPLEDALAAPAETLPQRREDLALVHRNGLRLLRLVNTLLDFSRIEAGRVEASFVPTDLPAHTAELAGVFRAAMERAGLRLTVDCPPLEEPVWVDRDMWEKIVLNLLSNAFKFTFKGEVAVFLRRQGDAVELSIRDTGTGIAEHEIPRLFDRFHRAEGARGRTHEGTGIGLALVQQLVRLHGGEVRAASALDKGSTFTVTIPLGTAHLPADRLQAARSLASTALGAEPYIAEAVRWLPGDDGGDKADRAVERALLPEQPLPATPGTDHERATILYADDNADMRAYVRHLLSGHYDVLTAANGAEAAAVLRSERRPDLLLSDVMMPQMDGFALLRVVRGDPDLAELPVILLSARAGEEASVEGLDAGADDYLVKPFSARELLARVRSNLKMARARRAAEDALRRTQSQLQAIFDQAPLGVYLVDGDFRIREVNPTALPVFGNIPDLIGRDFAEVIHVLWPKAYADELVERFRHTLRTGEPDQEPERIEERRDRGIVEHYEWRITRVPLPNGYGVACYFRDVSAQVLARRTIADSENRLRELNASLEARVGERTRELAEANDRLHRERLLSELIIENSVEGIIVVDNQLRYLVWNAGMERIIGLPRSAVLGRTLFEVFPHLVDHPIGQAWRDAVAGARTELRDCRYFAPARGVEIIYDSDHQPLYDAAGSNLGAICILREVTERHHMEQILLQSQKLEAVAQLTGGVAHDFNNLLTVVIGHAEGIARAAGDAGNIGHMADMVRRAAERGAQLTSQLLAFSRRQQLQPETISLHALILGVGELVRRAIGEAISLDLRPDPGLWPSHLDPARFESAILNLAINARDAMPEGGRLIIASSNLTLGNIEGGRLDLPPGDYVRVTVTDNGTGMTSEVQRRAFEPFFTTKDIGKGTGLGLAQIYGFVRQSGGTATIDSVVGRGTTVALYLPRAAAEAIEGPPPQPEETARGRGKTILVVEDQPDVLEVIEMFLDGLDYRIVTAADGVAARKLLESDEAIDLLLTDVVMPNGVSGLDLAQEARRLRQDLRIVMMSGYVRDAETCASAMRNVIFLEKPFRQTELANTISAALGDAR